jgi:hypothetical protein
MGYGLEVTRVAEFRRFPVDAVELRDTFLVGEADAAVVVWDARPRREPGAGNGPEKSLGSSTRETNTWDVSLPSRVPISGEAPILLARVLILKADVSLPKRSRISYIAGENASSKPIAFSRRTVRGTIVVPAIR